MNNFKGAIGSLAEIGLSSLHLYQMIYFTDSHLTEYLLSWYGLNQDTGKLQSEALKSLYLAQAWGNEAVQTLQTSIMVSGETFYA